MTRRSSARRIPVAAWAGVLLIVLVVGVAVLGPFTTPHSPTELAGIPFSEASRQFPFGTDYLGEDILSRVLAGGWRLLIEAAVATTIAYAIGGAIGLLAGFTRDRWRDAVPMRAMDVVLAFPPILFLLVIATGAGSSTVALVLAIAVLHLPPVARITRTATLSLVHRGYVEAAIARGDGTRVVLQREILPNVWPPLVADAGPRFTVSVLLVAAVSFLGLGPAPPAPDWALMIAENRGGITINPLAVLVPAALIGLLTIGINLFADWLGRRLDQRVDVAALRR